MIDDKTYTEDEIRLITIRAFILCTVTTTVSCNLTWILVLWWVYK